MTVLPRHIAFVMDGNGRWAKKRLLPRSLGHNEGIKTMEAMTDYVFNKGIAIVSFFAFSTENWNRPKREVNGLIKLLHDKLPELSRKISSKGANLVFSGDLSAFDDKLQKIIVASTVKNSQNNKTVNVCLNYGGRRDIVQAANLAVKNQKLVDEKSFLELLQTSPLPDPDLLIRTGGERRLSNFMLYQMAYTELYFSDKLWPDFCAEDFDAALSDFSVRNRRFGKITEE